MFERIRTIGGHRYLYEETRWREGRKVRSHSRYIRRLDGDPEQAMEKATKAADRAVAKLEKEQRAKYGKTVEEMRNEERCPKKEAPAKSESQVREEPETSKPDASEE